VRRVFDHPVHLNVERCEHAERIRYGGMRPNLDEQTILSMEPAKLREIACDLWMKDKVRGVLEAARKRGADVSVALALFPPPDDSMPWGS
jgi:hypothetical protein